MRIALFLALLTLAVSVFADVQVTQRGYFEVFSGDTKLSQHSTYRKALESAINHNGLSAVIRAPDVYVTKEERDIRLSYETPTTREDGSEFTTEDLKHFNIYVRSDTTDEVYVYSVKKESVVVGVPPGDWRFAVTVVDNEGLESQPSAERALLNSGVLR